MTLQEYILKNRKDQKLSRMELGRRAHLSMTEINRIETGDRKQPSLDHLLSLADALGVSRNQMLRIASGDDSIEIDSTTNNEALKARLMEMNETILKYEKISDKNFSFAFALFKWALEQNKC